MLLNKLKKEKKKVIGKEDLLKHIKENEFEVLLTMGAGDIDSLITPIETILKER